MQPLDWLAVALTLVIVGVVFGSALFVWWALQWGPWKNKGQKGD